MKNITFLAIEIPTTEEIVLGLIGTVILWCFIYWYSYRKEKS